MVLQNGGFAVSPMENTGVGISNLGYVSQKLAKHGNIRPIGMKSLVHLLSNVFEALSM